MGTMPIGSCEAAALSTGTRGGSLHILKKLLLVMFQDAFFSNNHDEMTYQCNNCVLNVLFKASYRGGEDVSMGESGGRPRTSFCGEVLDIKPK